MADVTTRTNSGSKVAHRAVFKTEEEARATPPPAGQKTRLWKTTDPSGDVWFTWADTYHGAAAQVGKYLGFKYEAVDKQRGVPLKQVVQTLSDEDLARLGLARLPATPKIAEDTVPATEGEVIPMPKKGKGKK